MATTINEIIKISLDKLRAEHLTLTPDNYAKVFCQVAKDRNVVVQDCQKVANTLKRLDKSLQEEAKRFKVSNVDELLKYFVALINRTNITESQKINQTFLLLCKRLLQVIAILHNKQATELANVSMGKLDLNYQIKTIEYLKDNWFGFLSSYNDEYFDKFQSIIKLDKNDLEKSLNDIYEYISKNESSSAYEHIVPIMVASLSPSIASSMNDELANLSQELRLKPDLLSSIAMQDDIKKLIQKRVELDKKEVENQILSLNDLLDAINQKIVNLLDTSEYHTKEVMNIKTDLQSFDVKKDSFEVIQARLLKIANSLETESTSLSEQMRSDKKTIEALKSKINKLEGALVEAKKESKEDFLTQVATKRALTNRLESIEDGFNRYGNDYSICFFDLDKFKGINDTYGHEAGDVILATLGKILNKYARRVDFIGRYGGEEFLTILPSINEEQAVIYSNKIRRIIENFKFIYKKERISVSISGGVAQRGKCKSLKHLLQVADRRLYDAKENGRNQIQPKLKDEK